MIRKFALVLILLFGISGCSTMSVFYESENPGQLAIGGGHLQLLFSNPEYTDLNPNDPLAKSEMIQNQLFGKTNGTPERYRGNWGDGSMEILDPGNLNVKKGTISMKFGRETFPPEFFACENGVDIPSGNPSS